MIRRQNISTTQDPLFPFCWELYLASFPEEERRELDYHIETMGKPQFRCDVVLDEDKPIGILFWWDLANFLYVEHLATDPKVRGKGYGQQILDELISSSDKPILLEVEHPTEEICRRRIGFYERIGFVLNPHPYSHPSYQQIESKFVSLMIMTHPNPITSSELESFCTEEFPTIHFRSYQRD